MSDEKDGSIHDRFFKEILSDIHLAKEWLDFFLPREIRELIELETLSYNKASFITDSLREIFSDMVFSCQFKKDGIHSPLTISLILEHKSRLGMIPHVQLLNYLAGAYHIQSKKKGKLQPVIPIVFYHGKRKYSKKKMLSYFSEAPSGTIKYLPLFEYFLIDMASYSDEKLWSLGNSFLSATMLTMKHYKDPVWLSNHIKSIYNSVFSTRDWNLHIRFTVYFYKMLDVSPKEYKLIIQKLPEIMSVQKKSLYDYIIEEGIEKGMVKGMEKGMEIGKQESKKQLYNKAVPNLLKLGLTIEQIASALNVDVEEIISFSKE